jgi:hypothetical protein
VYITQADFCEDAAMFNKTDIRSTYPWTQAVADGLLIDVTETARRACFNYPVAVTRAVWCQCVQGPAGADGQDEAARLSDVLDILMDDIRSIAGPGDALHFEVRVRDGNQEPRPVKLQAVIAFDDDGWPCLRVSLPGED